jgi:hypothetical protein
MFFLIAGLAVDVWLVTYLVLGSSTYACFTSATCFLLASLLWFVYPALLSHKNQR